jgi:hypothetical protein
MNKLTKIIIIVVFGFIVLNVALSFVQVDKDGEALLIDKEGNMEMIQVDNPNIKTINYQRQKVCYEPQQGFSDGATLCQDMSTIKKMDKYTIF